MTRHLPDGETMSIYDAAMRYAADGVPLVILAGKEYGSGSSRDWAAKGTALLGVRAVLAESFERIHRSNLIGMGVLPLQFADGATVESLGLTGEETITVAGLAGADVKSLIGRRLTVEADDQAGGGGAPDRHADGGRVPPPRRDPALRAAPAPRVPQLVSREATPQKATTKPRTMKVSVRPTGAFGRACPSSAWAARRGRGGEPAR